MQVGGSLRGRFQAFGLRLAVSGDERFQALGRPNLSEERVQQLEAAFQAVSVGFGRFQAGLCGGAAHLLDGRLGYIRYIR